MPKRLLLIKYFIFVALEASDFSKILSYQKRMQDSIHVFGIHTFFDSFSHLIRKPLQARFLVKIKSNHHQQKAVVNCSNSYEIFVWLFLILLTVLICNMLLLVF